jgi:hypothetical protein
LDDALGSYFPEPAALENCFSEFEDLVDKKNDNFSVFFKQIVSVFTAEFLNRFSSFFESCQSGVSFPSHKWHVVEAPDGEFPRIRTFKSLENTVKFIADRDGDQTSVAVVYGVSAYLTTRSVDPVSDDLTRYIVFSDKRAVKVEKGPLEFVPLASIHPSFRKQEDGWLGDAICDLSDYSEIEKVENE